MSNTNPLNQLSEIARKRPYPKLKHNLYEINLEHKTAFCTVCGYTEIHVSKSRTKRTPKIFCVNRFREIREENKNRRIEERGLKTGKSRHFLFEINTENMTATCAICGPTEIWKDTNGESTRYLCAEKTRAYMRTYRRTHYVSQVSNPHVHTLSNIDEQNKTAECSICGPVEIYVWQGKRKTGRRCSNASVIKIQPAQEIRREINTNLINQYKIKHGCKRCGYKTNPNLLDFHSGHSDKKVPKIEKLLMLNNKDLIQELENCEVLCIYCRSLVNVELG